MPNFKINIAGVFVESDHSSRAFLPSASTFFVTLFVAVLLFQFVPWSETFFNASFFAFMAVCLVAINVAAFQQITLEPGGITIHKRFFKKQAPLSGTFEEEHGFEFDDDDGYTISYSCLGSKTTRPIFIELRCLRRGWVVGWLMGQQNRIKSIAATTPRTTGVHRPLTDS